MKTLILKFSLILCLVLLGFKSAQATITISHYNPTTPGTIYTGQTGIVGDGITIAASNNGTNSTTLTAISFTIDKGTNNNNIAQISNFQLVSSRNGVIATALPASINSTGNSTTITFTGLSEVVTKTTSNVYLTFDFTGTGSGLTYNITTASYKISTNNNPTTPNSNTYTNAYVLKSPTLTLAVDNSNLASTTQTTSSTGAGIAVYGMSATSAGPSTFTALNFTTTSATGDNISPNYSTVALYKNTGSASFTNNGTQLVTTATGVINNPSTVTINLSTPQSIGDGVKVYYFLVVTYNQPTTTDAQMQFLTPTVTSTNGTTTTGNADGQNYTLTAPVITITASSLGSTNPTGSGLTASPAVSTFTNQAIAGLQLVGSGTGPARTITSLTFDPTTSGTNSGLFGATAYLYSSTTAAFGGVGASTTSSSAVASAPLGANGNNIVFSGLNISVSSTSTLYYFVVVSYATPVDITTPYELDYSSAVATGVTVAKGTIFKGYNYSFPATTITATSIGSAGTNGLAPATIIDPQNGLAIYGLQLSATGTAPARTITSITFDPNPTPANATTYTSNFFASMSLYASSSNSAADIIQPALATVNTAGMQSNNLTFTGLNIPVATGTPVYYFVVMNYTGVTTAASLQLSYYAASTTATANVATAGTGNAGITFAYAKQALTLAANNTGALSNTANLDHDLTQTVFFSFSATATGTTSLTGITLSGTTSMSANFSNMALYSSTSATFPGTGSATLVQTLTAPNSTSYSITGLTESLANTTRYYYLVADYTDKVVDASTPTYTFKLTAVASTPTASGAAQTGSAYTMSSPVTLDDPAFTNMAGNPLSTNASASGVPILGFSVTTTQAESFNKFVLTTAAGSTISPYFTGTPTLFVNTTNSGTGGIAVPTGAYTVTTTGITINLTTAQTFTGAGTKYYYLSFPTYTSPATATTFELDGTSVSTSTYTYTNGAPAKGTNYALGPPVYDWNGSTGTTVGATTYYYWTTPANWSVGGTVATIYPGQNGNTDQVRFGTNYNYTGTHQPTLNTSVTAASILFGYNNGNHDGNNVNVDLTVTGATLTAGTITQNHNASNDVYTLITGTGNLVCTGNFAVGDVTKPAADQLNITNVTTTINHMTINGNIIFNANGNGSTGVVGRTNGGGNNYPYFGLQKNTLSLYGQLIFNSNNNPISFGTGRGGDAVDYYQNVARFNMDMIASSPTYLELYNANTIPSPNANNYVDFTDLKGGSTVYYMDNNPNETQMVYTNGTLGLGTNDYNYINLVFSGASKKQVAGDVFSVGGSWTTSGGDIDLSTNAPTTYITYDTQGRNITDPQSNNTTNNFWTNSCNVNQGAATIEVGYTMTNTGNITCGSGSFQVDDQFTNSAGSFICGSGSVTYEGGYLNNAVFKAGSGMVYFTGTQTLKDNSTGGTTFNDVTFNSGTATMSSGVGNFAISNIGRLFVTNASSSSVSTLNAGTSTAAYLTLNSDGTSTATIEPLTPTTRNGHTYTPTITGAVNVQRFITGGPFRGYRLFSSPVNINQKTNQNGTSATTNEGFVDPTYLNSGMITAGPGTGFINNGFVNPLSYLYDDTRPSSASQFFSGKNVGLYSISGSPTYQVTPMSTGGTALLPYQLPVGNSMLTFYTGKVSLSSASPESNVATATGTLNQGNIILWLFNPNAAAAQTLVLPNPNSALGLNQIGNPYASTIQLSTFYNDNKTHIQPVVYELDATTGITGTYIGYNAGTNTTSSTNRASNYVVSGQGFWVQGTGGTVTFKETEKVDYPAITSSTVSSGSGGTASGGTLLMDAPPTVSNNDIKAGSFAENASAATATSTAPALVGLHLQLSKDSVKSAAYIQTGIYFSNQWTDTFNAQDDAIDRDGATPKIYFSSYSSDAKRLCINQLADYGKGKRIKLYAGATTSGLYYMSIADLLNIDTANYNIYLVDNKMSDSLDMVKYKSYAFNINNADTSTYGANRFVLAVERKALPPYALITFSGQKVSNGVQLFWKTLNEGTYTNFAVQKLGGSNTYSSIYTTQGTGAGIYSDVDLHPSNGANTYRLQQTDINGIVTYSQPVTINYSARATNGSLTIYPNPSKTIINISLNTSNTGSKNYIADIYNTSGSVVGHKIVNADTWTQDISAYKLGVYVIEIKTDTGNLVGQSKFVKIN